MINNNASMLYTKFPKKRFIESNDYNLEFAQGTFIRRLFIRKDADKKFRSTEGMQRTLAA